MHVCYILQNTGSRQYPIEDHLLTNDTDTDDDLEDVDMEQREQDTFPTNSQQSRWTSRFPANTSGLANFNNFSNLLGGRTSLVNNGEQLSNRNQTLNMVLSRINPTASEELPDTTHHEERPGHGDSALCNSNTNDFEDGDFADITSELFNLNSDQLSALIDFSDSSTHQPNIENDYESEEPDLSPDSNIHNNASNNSQNNQQNDCNSSLERQLPLHLLSLFEDSNHECGSYVELSQNNRSIQQNASDSSSEETIPPSLRALFIGPSQHESLRVESNSYNSIPSHSRENRNTTHESNIVGHTESSSSEPPIFTLGRPNLWRPLSNNAAMSNNVTQQRLGNSLVPNFHNCQPDNHSNRSSVGSSGRNPGLQENWYIYDPRLIPRGRLERHNQLMLGQGEPVIVGPPAYDDLSSRYSGDNYGAEQLVDTEIPEEPPPPYIENVAEVSLIPPPPSYDEAVFNSMFTDFERENLTLNSTLLPAPLTPQPQNTETNAFCNENVSQNLRSTNDLLDDILFLNNENEDDEEGTFSNDEEALPDILWPDRSSNQHVISSSEANGFGLNRNWTRPSPWRPSYESGSQHFMGIPIGLSNSWVRWGQDLSTRLTNAAGNIM